MFYGKVMQAEQTLCHPVEGWCQEAERPWKKLCRDGTSQWGLAMVFHSLQEKAAVGNGVRADMLACSETARRVREENDTSLRGRFYEKEAGKMTQLRERMAKGQSMAG